MTRVNYENEIFIGASNNVMNLMGNRLHCNFFAFLNSLFFSSRLVFFSRSMWWLNYRFGNDKSKKRGLLNYDDDCRHYARQWQPRLWKKKKADSVSTADLSALIKPPKRLVFHRILCFWASVDRIESSLSCEWNGARQRRRKNSAPGNCRRKWNQNELPWQLPGSTNHAFDSD